MDASLQDKVRIFIPKYFHSQMEALPSWKCPNWICIKTSLSCLSSVARFLDRLPVSRLASQWVARLRWETEQRTSSPHLSNTVQRGGLSENSSAIQSASPSAPKAYNTALEDRGQLCVSASVMCPKAVCVTHNKGGEYLQRGGRDRRKLRKKLWGERCGFWRQRKWKQSNGNEGGVKNE